MSRLTIGTGCVALGTATVLASVLVDASVYVALAGVALTATGTVTAWKAGP